MGLDQYFHRQVHTHATLRDVSTPCKTHDGKIIPPRNLGFMVSRTTDDLVGYLRKVNSVHGWIVDNLAGGEDECQKIYMSPDDLTALHDAIDTALSTGVGMEPRSGFFFGSSEKDEYWRQDLEDAKAIVEWLLEDAAATDFDPDDWRQSKTFYYQASW